MGYASYDYYCEKFQGKAITEEAFTRLGVRADAFLRCVTFGRSAQAGSDDMLKDAECALIEQLSDYEKSDAEGGIVASESVGSHSISYAVDAAQNSQTARAGQLYQIVSLYLSGTGLLFRGVTR